MYFFRNIFLIKKGMTVGRPYSPPIIISGCT
ncbi:hypothetical protein M122_4143, partial [Bacteroides fragilis str. 3976T7]